MESGKPQNTAPKPSGIKAAKLSQKEQSERFVETARMINSDETGDLFEKAIVMVVPVKNLED